jgi:CubicO group peptidase (beta-lactamase class C family)
MRSSLLSSFKMLALLFAACIPHQAMAQTPAFTQPLASIELKHFMDDFMRDQLKRKQIAGAVVTVVSDGTIILNRGYGFANVAKAVPMQADATLLRPGSISKLLTAIAVVQLADQGKLELDRDVNDYLDFKLPTPPGGVPVTLRRLLGHRAGFEQHIKGLFQAGTAPEPLGAWLKHALPPRLFPKGDVQAYSNYGYGLAGYIVERVSGKRFEDYAQADLLAQLQMDASTFAQPLPASRRGLVALAYNASNAPLPTFETIMPAPAGALSTTGTDMGRLMLALLGGGNKLLAGSTFEGLPGVEVDHAEGNRFIGKHGLTSATVSYLGLLPQERFGIFVSYNSATAGIGGPDSAPSELLRAVAGRYFKRATVSVAPIASERSDAHAASGSYQITMRADSSFVRLPALMQQLTVSTAAGGGIRIDGMAGSLRGTAPMVFTGPNDARVSFRRGADGHNYMHASMIPLAVEWQAVPWYLDKRFVLPAVLGSAMLIVVSLLCWPIGALLRRRHAVHYGTCPRDRREHGMVRFALLLNLLTLAGTVGLAAISADLMRLNASLDSTLLALHALAWCTVAATPFVAAIAVRFWRDQVGSRWARIHHTLIAVAMVLFSYFLVMWGIAGTTLNY